MKVKTKNKGSIKTLPIFVVYKDIVNYIKWIKTINRERSTSNSEFNRFKLNHNYFYTLYMTFTLPDEDYMLPESIKKLRILESLTPVHQYLDSKLNFAEYIVPEFNQFYDDENNPTLTYGIIYRFAFKRLSLGFVLKRGILITLIIFLLVKFPILSTLWSWITLLI